MRDYHGDLSVVTGPVLAPLSTAEAKAQTRVDIDADDTLIAGYVDGARQLFEELADKCLLTTTYCLSMDCWPSSPWIALPRPPLASVTSVVYYDEDNNPTTWSSDNYLVITKPTPGGILRKASRDWPSVTLREKAGIEITFVAGYTQTSDVPQKYKHACALLVGHWYENREDAITTGAVPKSIPMGFDSILLASRTN